MLPNYAIRHNGTMLDEYYACQANGPPPRTRETLRTPESTVYDMHRYSLYIWRRIPALFLAALVISQTPLTARAVTEATTEADTALPESEPKEKVIKWIDFTVTAAALSDAVKADIAAHGEGRSLSCVTLLAYLAQKYGGDFSHYRKKDLDAAVTESRTRPLEESAKNQKLFKYYMKAYTAVLGGLVGEYTLETDNGNGTVTNEEKYGVRRVFPIARGYAFQHYDDFGASRSYGYRRRHLGHDMMGTVGTPIIAMEGGYVEALGWNQYGGWRVGIRSFDGLRYYYYAHLRRGHPYCDLYEGKTVSAGEVIGYLGMTGYSTKKDTNNINVPHLHAGLEIIFSPEQKDGYCQIWVNLYEYTRFLLPYRSGVFKTEIEGKQEMRSKTRIITKDDPD